MSDQPRYRLVLLSLSDPEGVPAPRRLARLLKHALKIRRFKCLEACQERGVSFGEFRAAVEKLRAAEKREDLTPAEGREQVALRARVDAMLSELNESDLPPEPS